MRTLLTLVRKDLIGFLRNRAALTLTFVVPIALIFIFGQVFGLNRKDSGPTGIRLAVVNASSEPAAAKLVDALRAEKSFRVITEFINPDQSRRPLTEDDARAQIRDRQLRFAVVIPHDLIAENEFGLHLKILSDPRNEIETQLVNGLLQKTIFSNVPELLGQSLQARAKKFLGDDSLKRFNGTVATAVASAFGGDAAEIQRRIESGDLGLGTLSSTGKPAPKAADPSLRTLAAPPSTPANADGEKKPVDDIFSRLVRIEKEQVVGKDVKSPDATRVIGGQAMMFLLFALSGSAAAFFDEKNSGIFQRLLASPVTRAHLLWSRFIYGVVVGLVQLVVLFFAGQLMFGVDVLGHLGLLLVVSTAAAAACTAFGMFIAAFTPNAQAASGLATLLVLTMSATGGAWFPTALMPEFMQTIGKFTLVYWSMEGFAQVLWAGQSLVQILPTIGILAGIAATVMSLAVWRLNRSKLFE
ncbi:MAG: ABC transporter permease [Verrucomicrobia bacterium]|nr:ABC transporter permease [Verrucomicrobiota bacterium]